MKIARGQKGFTLIELAIVLVIIGIILGAVLKGQDLIQSARVKKFISDAGKKWEIATWAYFDRKGWFPGDLNKDGIIGDGNPKQDILDAAFINPPESPIVLGSFSFYVFLGNDNGTPKKNVLVICKAIDCGTAFIADELEYIEAFDTALDGSSDGTAGQVRAANTSATVDNAKWLVTAVSPAPATGTWTANTTKALVYYFDRKP